MSARAVLVLALLLPLLPGAVTDARAQSVLDDRIAALSRSAFDHPQAAQQGLDQLERGAASQDERDRIAYARARLRVRSRDVAGLDAFAEQIALRADWAGRADLLRAELADANGRPAEVLAPIVERARETLAASCAGPDATTLEPACRFRELVDALRMDAQIAVGDGEFARAESYLQQALHLATAGGDRDRSVQVLNRLARFSQVQGHPETARRWLEESGRAAQDDERLRVDVYTTEGALAEMSGNRAGEFRAVEKALELARRADLPHTLAFLQTGLTDFYLGDGKPSDAIALGRAAMPVLHRFHDRNTLRVLYHNLGIASIDLRQFAAARSYLAQAEEQRGGAADSMMEVNELGELAEAWAQAGNPREAIRVYRAERKLTERLQAHGREAALRQIRAHLDSERKERDLELLHRETQLQDQEIENRELGQKLGMAVAGLMALSLLFAVTMLLRMRSANSQLRQRQEMLRVQSERDPLTNLANRRYLLALMQRRAPVRLDGALLMVDIDRFKRINDGHGHAAGDAVIEQAALRLRQAVRSQDVVVRWGGEEFLVLVPTQPPEQIQALALRILAAFACEPIGTAEGPIPVTVSIGFAAFPLPPRALALPWERAINWADKALYLAKAAGRNQAIGIVSVEAEDLATLDAIEADLEHACTHGSVQILTLRGPEPGGASAAAGTAGATDPALDAQRADPVVHKEMTASPG